MINFPHSTFKYQGLGYSVFYLPNFQNVTFFPISLYRIYTLAKIRYRLLKFTSQLAVLRPPRDAYRYVVFFLISIPTAITFWYTRYTHNQPYCSEGNCSWPIIVGKQRSVIRSTSAPPTAYYYCLCSVDAQWLQQWWHPQRLSGQYFLVKCPHFIWIYWSFMVSKVVFWILVLIRISFWVRHINTSNQ